MAALIVAKHVFSARKCQHADKTGYHIGVVRFFAVMSVAVQE
jgi:hypothetical protein